MMDGDEDSGAEFGAVGGEETSPLDLILVATTRLVVDRRRLRRPTRLGDRERTATVSNHSGQYTPNKSASDSVDSDRDV